MLGSLFGLAAPPLDSARVLELGGASGGNLIPLAALYPDATFVSVDASTRQVAAGWEVIEKLGLKNIDLRHYDIGAIDRGFGEFDYILCHGVFSWVPAQIQDRIIEISKRNLAQNGIAYISYNTYPGWHIRGIVRDILQFRGEQFSDVDERLRKAKEFVDFLVQSGRPDVSLYTQLLKGEAELLGKVSDSYIHHEHFEDNNQPMYFRDFASKLQVHGLQYLGEADFASMVAGNLAPDVSRAVIDLAGNDIVQTEQIMDFLRCRFFRQTLACHRSVALNRNIQADAVRGTWISASLKSAGAKVDLGQDVVEQFGNERGDQIATGAPVSKAAIAALQASWPLPLPFEELLDQAVSAVKAAGVGVGDRAALAAQLAADLLMGFAGGLVRLQAAAPRFVTRPGKKPRAFALARVLAASGAEVSSLRHENVRLDELHQNVLKLLDGTRDIDQIQGALLELVRSGRITVRRGDQPIDPDEAASVLKEVTSKAIDNLARLALIEA